VLVSTNHQGFGDDADKHMLLQQPKTSRDQMLLPDA
jgi:hypothetical protein